MTEERRGTGGPGFHFVQSLARGLAVISSFDAEHRRLTLSEVAQRTGINRAAARRFLLTLVDLGYITTDGRYFSLQPKVLALGYSYLSSLTMLEMATPHLRALAVAVGESTYLSVREGDEIVCVANFPVRRIWSTVLTVGTRLSALGTAAGRVLLAGQSREWLEGFLATRSEQRHTAHAITGRQELLAELDLVRKQGWALIDQEMEEGVRTVAVPVRDEAGTPRVAVSVSKLAGRADIEETRAELLPPLLDTARSIKRDLSQNPAPDAWP